MLEVQAGSLRKSVLVWVLVAIVLLASADRQPDPPALAPHPDKAAAYCATAHLVPLLVQASQFSLFGSILAKQSRVVELHWLTFASPSLPSTVSIPAAADSSPPSLLS